MLRFNSIFNDTKERKQSLDDLVTEWMNDLLRGESQLISVVGKEEYGSQYLLKGTSLNPGIVPLIEKRIASLCADSTLTAKFSYLRYTNGILRVLLFDPRCLLGHPKLESHSRIFGKVGGV